MRRANLAPFIPLGRCFGWRRVPGPDQVDRDFYVRHLKDWKFSAPIELAVPSGLRVYAGLCGWALARAHARSGDRVALAAYLGGSWARSCW